ncbi:hypothetical protein DFJ74DRAFT_713418 [Hyaloraphidium curvatum]|nr:hypothetical protein DFJ74DRAFT_713418 [Hyaloraphidium curvatum]
MAISGFPRIAHLPGSPGAQSDDIFVSAAGDAGFVGVDFIAGFVGVDFIATEKLDGGCTCLHGGQVYARTLSQPSSHPSFSLIKSDVLPLLAGRVSNELFLFGENVTAVHSITYRVVPSPFFLFAVYGPRDDAGGTAVWWSWDEMAGLAEELGIPVPPVLFRGTLSTPDDLAALIDRAMAAGSAFGPEIEGVVVRRAGRLRTREGTGEFEGAAKWVRAGHVQTGPDWRRTWKKQNMGSYPPIWV